MAENKKLPNWAQGMGPELTSSAETEKHIRAGGRVVIGGPGDVPEGGQHYCLVYGFKKSPVSRDPNYAERLLRKKKGAVVHGPCSRQEADKFVEDKRVPPRFPYFAIGVFAVGEGPHPDWRPE